MNVKQMTLRITFLLLIGLLASCTPNDETAAPQPTLTTSAESQNTETPEGEIIPNEAMVETVDVLIMESMPVQIAVQISGNLPDGCTTIDTIEATREGTTFIINILTKRDPLALCTAALVPFSERVSLDVVGLEAGTYTVNVVGRDETVTQTFELAIDNVPVEEPRLTPTTEPTPVPEETPVAAELPAGCLPTGEQNGPFINLQDGYCLQYPASEGFRVSDVFPGGIAAIWGPPLTPNLEPIRSGLTILKLELAAGRSLDEIVAEVLVANPDGQVVDAAATFAGEPAQVVEGLPGMMDSRRHYLIHNDFLYEVTLVPLTDQTEFSEEVMAQRDLLWQTVSETFTWLPAEMAQFAPCPPIEEGRSPYVNVPGGFCLQYPSHYRQQDLFSQNQLLFLGGVLDPTIPEPVQVTLIIDFSAANGRTLEQVVADLVVGLEGLEIEQSETTLGGQPAVMLLGLPGLNAGRDLFAIHNDTVYHLRIDPLGVPELADDLDATWEMVLESFTFLP